MISSGLQFITNNMFFIVLFVMLIASLYILTALWIKMDTYKRLSSRLYNLNKREITPTLSTQKRMSDSLIKQLTKLAEYFKLFDRHEHKPTILLLAQAGHTNKTSLIIYSFIQIVIPGIFGMSAFIIAQAGIIIHFSFTQQMIFVTCAIIVGTYLPIFVLKKLAKHYQSKIYRSLPDVMDLMVMCLEAGYGTDEIFDLIAYEFQHLAPAMAEQLYITTMELRLLPARRLGWRNLMLRVPLDEIKNLVACIEQNEKYGTSLLNNVKMLILHIRKEQVLKAEDKAGRLPAILTLVMVFFIFPITLILLLTPALIRALS